jgi:spoIIIJ-associated protein
MDITKLQSLLSKNAKKDIMDFKDSIQQIVERIEKIKDNLQTEEATKMSLIVPMLQALGYDVFNAMNLTANVIVKYDEDTREMDIEIEGDDMSVLIGKRGATLDSLQYLASLVANKGTEEYIRVKVDTENYRERRKKTLENLAKNMAFKVKRSRRSLSLEPMNPYERRIIHSALQNDRYVTTHSEGEEPYRKVVVTLKNAH